jgi:hypothetical protein
MRSDKENEYHVLDRTRSRRVLQTRRSNTKPLCGIRECEYSIVWKHTAVEISDGDGAAAADMPKKDLDRPWQGAAEETFHSTFGTVHICYCRGQRTHVLGRQQILPLELT